MALNGTLVVLSGSSAVFQDPDGNTVGQFVFGENPSQDINTCLLLLASYLVFFMQAGFAMLSAGSVRAKNTKTIILKNLLDSCVGAVMFYLCGYGFAFGGLGDAQNGNTFIGHQWFAFKNYDVGGDFGYGAYSYWLFQFAFCAASSSIVSGAVEERMNFGCYMLYAAYLTGFVYPVIAHWVWSTTGWLASGKIDNTFNGTGMLDFAGSGVVHMTGGVSGLIGAVALGPRIGRFDANGKPQPMPGHSASLTILGVFLLWFGWYGFNPGSALIFVNNSNVTSLAAVNSTMAASSATLSAMFVLMAIEYFNTGLVLWDLIGAGNGTLAGLVAITANCAYVETWAALTIGIIAGAVYCAGSYVVLNILKVDDPLDAVAVHMCNGMWGLLAAATFANQPYVAAAYAGLPVATEPGAYGFIMGGNGKLLVAAITGICAISAWCILTMGPFFFGLKFAGALRVSPEEEMAGLDVSHHGGVAYNGADLPETKGVQSDYVKDSGNGAVDYERVKSLEASLTQLSNRLAAVESKNRAVEDA